MLASRYTHLHVIIVIGELVEVDVGAGDLLEEAEDLIGGHLEVRGGVHGRGNEHVVSTISDGDEVGSNPGEVLADGTTEELVGSLDLVLSVRLGTLEDGGHHCDVPAIGGDSLLGRHDGDVDVVLALELLGGDDELEGVGVVGVGHGVLHEDDGADDGAVLLHLGGLESEHVGGVSKDHLGLDDSALDLDTDDLAVLVDELLDLLLEHLDATGDGAETGETLGDTAETVLGVDEGGRTETGKRVSVKLALLDGISGGLVEVVVVLVQSDGVTSELDGVLTERATSEDLTSSGLLHINTFPSRRVREVVVINPLEEVLEATLLEETKQGSGESLTSAGRDLVDLTTVGNVRAADEKEVEIAGDTSGTKKLDEVTTRHQELGAKINRPITSITKELGDLGALRAETLVEISEGDGGTLTTVVGFLIKGKNLHTLLLKNSRQDTNTRISSKANKVVFFVHL